MEGGGAESSQRALEQGGDSWDLGSGLDCRAQKAGAAYEGLRIHVIAMVAVSGISFSYCCVVGVFWVFDLVLGLPGALMCLTAGGVYLGSPGGPSRELPLLLGVPGPLTGTRPTNQANLQRWLLLTASALFVLVLAFSLVEALRNLGNKKMFLVSVSGVGWMGVQLAVNAFLAKRLAAVVRVLDPVTSGLVAGEIKVQD